MCFPYFNHISITSVIKCVYFHHALLQTVIKCVYFNHVCYNRDKKNFFITVFSTLIKCVSIFLSYFDYKFDGLVTTLLFILVFFLILLPYAFTFGDETNVCCLMQCLCRPKYELSRQSRIWQRHNGDKLKMLVSKEKTCH